MCFWTIASAWSSETVRRLGQLTRIASRERSDGRHHLVNLGLRERRLVAFVVAVAAIADQIDQRIEAGSDAGTPRPDAPLRCRRPDRRR